MTLHVLDRGYPIDLLQESAIKARWLYRFTLLHPPSSSHTATTDCSILVTTFHPREDSLKWVVKKNWSILGKNHSMLRVYNRKLLIPYRRPQKLKDLLVWADCTIKPSWYKEKRPTPFLSTQGPSISPGTKQTAIIDFFKKCLITSSTSLIDLTTRVGTTPHLSKSKTFSSKPLRRICTYLKCQFYPLLRYTFQCTTTSVKYSCKHNITCKSSNQIYCITCKTCTKQYVGQTKNSIAQTFNSHFFNIKQTNWCSRTSFFLEQTTMVQQMWWLMS